MTSEVAGGSNALFWRGMDAELFWRGIAVELVLCLGTTGELLVRGIELFWRGTLDAAGL